MRVQLQLIAVVMAALLLTSACGSDADTSPIASAATGGEETPSSTPTKKLPRFFQADVMTAPGTPHWT